MREQLRALYPDLSDEELETAEENLNRYLELAWDIWEDAESHFDSQNYNR